VTFDTLRYGGRQVRKEFDVETNVAGHPPLVVSLECNPEKWVTITPGVLRLVGPLGAAIKDRVTLVPSQKHPFRILGIVAGTPPTANYAPPILTKAKDKLEYILEVESTRSEPGGYSEKIILETDSPIRNHLEIGIIGNI